MSQRPLFTSAPRLKLRVNGQTVAYAIGFNVNVSVGVEPIYVVGEYGPVALEPTMYNIVTGAIQIVRLRSRDAMTAAFAAAGNGATGSIASGFNPAATSGQPAQSVNSVLNQQNLFRMLDPAQVLLTKSFDIDVYIKVPVIASNAKLASGQNVTPGVTTVNAVGGNSNGLIEEFKLMTVKDCRITSRNTNISMGSIVNEPVTFQGLLLVNNSDDETSGPIESDSGMKQQ